MCYPCGGGPKLNFFLDLCLTKFINIPDRPAMHRMKSKGERVSSCQNPRLGLKGEEMFPLHDIEIEVAHLIVR